VTSNEFRLDFQQVATAPSLKIRHYPNVYAEKSNTENAAREAPALLP